MSTETPFPWERKQVQEHVKVMEYNETPEPADVPIDLLNVDTTYQAMEPRNPRLIREIGKKFDLAVFGRLRVVRREDGRLFVVDGRHRWEGARRARRHLVPCDIYNVHDRKREIEIFLACNTRIRKVPQGMLFMAEKEAGDEHAIQLFNLVQDAGLAIVDANTARQEFDVPKIGCIAALKSLQGYGSLSYAKRATPVPPEQLTEALGLISELAPPNALVTEHVTLGFVWLVHNYPKLRDHVKRLNELGWPRIDMAARAVGPRPKAEDAGRALLAVIDFRRPEKARLAPGLELPAPPDHLPPMAKAAA
jgi:hypothetical protein